MGSTHCLIKGFFFRDNIDGLKYTGLEINKKKLEYTEDLYEYYNFMEFHHAYLTPIREEYELGDDVEPEYYEVDVLNQKHATRFTE